MDLRKLDEWIAEFVMGWKVEVIDSFWSQGDAYKTWYPPNGNGILHSVPYFSSNMSDAWRVVEYIVNNMQASVEVYSINREYKPWACKIGNDVREWDNDAAVAICLAARSYIGGCNDTTKT
jgi:hypothetical protein